MASSILFLENMRALVAFLVEIWNFLTFNSSSRFLLVHSWLGMGFVKVHQWCARARHVIAAPTSRIILAIWVRISRWDMLVTIVVSPNGRNSFTEIWLLEMVDRDICHGLGPMGFAIGLLFDFVQEVLWHVWIDLLFLH
jgi:hypothetical protein